MIAEYMDPGGFRFKVFNSEHMDFGLEISNPDGDVVYSSPCALSYESYGLKPHWKYRHLDDAIEAEKNGDERAFVLWTDSDWKKCLKEELHMLLSVFCPEGDSYETTENDERYSQGSSHAGEDI